MPTQSVSWQRRMIAQAKAAGDTGPNGLEQMREMWYNTRVNLNKIDGRSGACNTLRPDTRKDKFLMQPHSTTDPYYPENLEDYAPWVAEHGLRAPYGKCQCGCGTDVSIARRPNLAYGIWRGHPVRFIYNHHQRQVGKIAPWVEVYGLTHPYGLCQCGCGENAPIAESGNIRRGLKKGEPTRFVAGHNGAGPRTPIDRLVLAPGVRAIPLTRGRVALVDSADYEWLSQWRWYAIPDNGRWYAVRNDRSGGKNTMISMHRVIVDAPKGVQVDHIDGDGLNNCRSNLRFATQSQNSCNSRLRSDNKTGFRGVSWSKLDEKYAANIQVGGISKKIGCFDDPIEAAHAYDNAARELHGEFARLNFPENDAP